MTKVDRRPDALRVPTRLFAVARNEFDFDSVGILEPDGPSAGCAGFSLATVFIENRHAPLPQLLGQLQHPIPGARPKRDVIEPRPPAMEALRSMRLRGLDQDDVAGAAPPTPSLFPFLIGLEADLEKKPSPELNRASEIADIDLDMVDAATGRRFGHVPILPGRLAKETRRAI